MNQESHQNPENNSNSKFREVLKVLVNHRLAIGSVIFLAGVADLGFQIYNQGHMNGMFLVNSRMSFDTIVSTIGAAPIVENIYHKLNPNETNFESKLLNRAVLAVCYISTLVGVGFYINDIWHGRANTLDYYSTLQFKMEAVLMSPSLYLGFKLMFDK